jgi:putative redox protein
MATVKAAHAGGDSFDVSVRQHTLRVDQPATDGGEDSGPTPTELFVASLTACVAHYARRFLVRHGLSFEGLCVQAEFTMAERPARVGSITITLDVPAGIPENKRAAFLAVASHCTVHNTLETPPDIRFLLSGEKEQAA